MASRPSILLIFTDQQRADTLHAAGNPMIQTPTLDRLLCEGVHFTPDLQALWGFHSQEMLQETGQLDNTLILFTSDHGEFLGDYDCFGKRSMLDAAARAPLLVR